jgi:hypothetical protein
MEGQHNKAWWRELFIDKSVDFILLIVGVYIAFQLNNWKVENDQVAQERAYLNDMLVDIDKDIKELKENLSSLQSDKMSLDDYLKNGSNQPSDSLANMLLNVLSFETFNSNQSAYQTLVSGNALSSFHDHELRNQMTEYYGLYAPILRFEEVYTSLLFKLAEHFTNSVDYTEGKVIDSSVINKSSTKNFYLLVNGQLQDGIEAYTDALEKAEALRASIKALDQQE